ncbi:hypothetical protein SPHINGO361_130143 [Sphingomonas sp. EC-HK361]|uniref:hypothetical protein n=1 Tax=Sphingomonas sp. EC-HK361 TaxID=2038397 RepID=UPI0012585C36|nr:hypothetical protein [Sphingomonas sp. EC-HK361]VVT13288.1 hypothetical protein SPHINGO361_130143 [Sphingomonas sp. EC-HK361]
MRKATGAVFLSLGRVVLAPAGPSEDRTGRVGSFAPTVSSAREDARQQLMQREDAAA